MSLKMKHFRIFYLFFVSALLFYGCGGSDDSKNENNNPTDPTDQTTQETMDDYPNPPVDNNPIVDYTKWAVKDGQFFLDGKHVFLKVAKPLQSFATAEGCDKVKSWIATYREKYFNAVAMNCYWHQFDNDGDGTIDVSLKPLKNLIEAIYDAGMYPCLTVETYSVGGGQIPSGFWEKYPDAVAIDSNGSQVKDDEYGFGTAVADIFNVNYRETVHKYMQNLVKGLQNEGLDLKKILYYETTVEPQYMGNRSLSYSKAALNEYNVWRETNNISDAESAMPVDQDGNVKFPVPASFVENATWNKFRAQFLAKWVNDDAAAFKSVAGDDIQIAVDYLDAAESTMQNRDGNPDEFLAALTSATIIQINWTWYFPENKINQKAYDRVHNANNTYNRNWAISEHMTLNGSDWDNLSIKTIDKVLENTLKQGTRWGWEFVNVSPNSNDTFCVYNSDWSPKRHMKYVDAHWGWWLHRIELYDAGKL